MTFKQWTTTKAYAKAFILPRGYDFAQAAWNAAKRDERGRVCKCGSHVVIRNSERCHYCPFCGGKIKEVAK